MLKFPLSTKVSAPEAPAQKGAHLHRRTLLRMCLVSTGVWPYPCHYSEYSFDTAREDGAISTCPSPITISPQPQVPDNWSWMHSRSKVCFVRKFTINKTGTSIKTIPNSTALSHWCHRDLQAGMMRYMQKDSVSMPKELSVAVKRFPQGPETSIRNYPTSFLGNATICNFIVGWKLHNCNHFFEFSNKILKGNIFLGISGAKTLVEKGKATRSTFSNSNKFMITNSKANKPRKSDRNTIKCWTRFKTSQG